jgi:hypothetical protein
MNGAFYTVICSLCVDGVVTCLYVHDCCGCKFRPVLHLFSSRTHVITSAPRKARGCEPVFGTFGTRAVPNWEGVQITRNAIHLTTHPPTIFHLLPSSLPFFIPAVSPTRRNTPIFFFFFLHSLLRYEAPSFDHSFIPFGRYV